MVRRIAALSTASSNFRKRTMEHHDDSNLHRIRHSLAHVLAQAVLELRPGSTLGFGPPISDGFYYDFILSEPLTDDDFPTIEKKMRSIPGWIVLDQQLPVVDPTK